MIAQRAGIALLALAAICPGVAFADPSDGEAPPTLDEVLRGTDRVPDNPAIDLLGAEDLKVVKPGSIKDFGVELRNLYKDGKIVPEIAIELSPWGLTGGKGSHYDDYLAHWATRLLRRFTVSIATTSVGSGDSQTTLGAVGWRLRLIDDADWRLNRELVQCALDKWSLPPPPAAPDGDGGLVPVAAPGTTTAAVERCMLDHAKPWNAPQLALGGALSSAFPAGKLRWDLDDAVVWASFAFGVNKTAGVTLGAKYLYNDAHTLDPMTRPSRHTIAIDGNFEIRDSRVGLLANLGIGERWTRGDMSTSTMQTVGVMGAEVQFQIADDSWLSLRFSAQLVSTDSELISLVNLKWNIDLTPDRK
jgi:hypothetical protein